MVNSDKVEQYFWSAFDIITLLGAAVLLRILCRYKLKVPLCFQLTGLIVVSSATGLTYDVLTFVRFEESGAEEYRRVSDPIRAICLGAMNGTFVAQYWLYAIKYYNASFEMPKRVAPQNLHESQQL